MLERAALRIGAVMALTNGFVPLDAEAGTYPTLAGQRVYDSRMDPIEGLDSQELVPVVLVYTDNTDGESLSANNGGPPFRHNVNLVFELSIGMYVDEETGVVVIQSEPELEAMLDLFEHQVRRAISHPSWLWSRRLVEPGKDLLIRVASWDSQRYVERDASARLAARQIIARVELPQVDLDEMTTEAPASPPPIPAPLGPLLGEIIAADGPYATTAAAIRDLLQEAGAGQPLLLGTLDKVRLIESNKGGGNLTGDDFARPDGVAEADLT